ncbi:MAG: hypothetical protein WD273_10245 [Trueperaceae bacterium]
MSEEPKHTFSAREIVLEFFPATDSRLVPKGHAYQLDRSGDGSLIIRDRQERELGRLLPVTEAGSSSTQLCCDLCGWNGIRQYLQILRAEVPGSNGRRFRYLTACRNTQDCEARRLDDEPVRMLLEDN